MARQARFVMPAVAHLVVQRGHNGCAIALDGADRMQWLDVLRDVAATHRVDIHGWCLHEARFCLLVRPPAAAALGRLVQDLGRRYVVYFNARHGRSGTLWDGRFRSAAAMTESWEIAALIYVESEAGTDIDVSSRGHHLGHRVDPFVIDPPAYWGLGNTPFDRHGAWQSRLESGLDSAERHHIEAALRAGTPLAPQALLEQLQTEMQRRLVPRPRGRPRRIA